MQFLNVAREFGMVVKIKFQQNFNWEICTLLYSRTSKKSTLGKDTPFSPGTNDRIVDMIGDAYVFGPTEYLVNLVQQSSAQPIYSYR